jgi:hypothetical protein
MKYEKNIIFLVPLITFRDLSDNKRKPILYVHKTNKKPITKIDGISWYNL